MNADDVAASMTEVWQELTPLIAGSRLLRKGGVVALVTGMPQPLVNRVWLERPNPNAATLAAVLDEVAAAGVPHCLQLRPGSDDVLTEVAVTRGMTRGEEIPVMVLDAAAAAVNRPPAGFSVRRLSPGQARVHARVVAGGFGIPEDHVLRLRNPDVLGLGSVRCYAGEANGQPVSTGIGQTLGGRTGIFDVATLPGFQRRGFGTAVTARAVADGLAAGARWCWLQSSSEGYRTYKSLGFQTIETWSWWMSAA